MSNRFRGTLTDRANTFNFNPLLRKKFGCALIRELNCNGESMTQITYQKKIIIMTQINDALQS